MATKIDYARFTQQQVEAARLLAAPDEEDRRLTYEEVATRVGITRKTLYNWRLDDEFRALVNDLADKAMDGFLTDIYAALKHRVTVDKSDKAIEIALKRMGKLRDVSDVHATVTDERDSAKVADEIEELKRQLAGDNANV